MRKTRRKLSKPLAQADENLKVTINRYQPGLYSSTVALKAEDWHTFAQYPFRCRIGCIAITARGKSFIKVVSDESH